MKQNPRSPIQLKTKTRPFLIAIALALGYFALSPAPNAFGVIPAPDGGYPGNNTAEGANALFSLTSGIDNNALGFQALYHNNTGNYNTAEGYRSLFTNTTGANNTATGVQALYSNTTGNYNTALGVNSLYRNTYGVENTAVGVQALFTNTTGNYNTALGTSALYRNTDGENNTATGWQALFNNNTGDGNTANGYQALFNNTSVNGKYNTATGYQALFNNTSGGHNTAIGENALNDNTGGSWNTAIGSGALGDNTYADYNTAVGYGALFSNTTGWYNTAVGVGALDQNHGHDNVALGFDAGHNHTDGSYNIDIGTPGAPFESNTIRIGVNQQHHATYIAGISGKTAAGGAAVFVASNGKLGTVTSSRRFKKDIADMNTASEALFALRPVTFRYKPELDQVGIPQYGLVAEEVAKVNPDLVVRDEKGEIYTVRYEAVNAMLLNEFLKEHRKVECLEVTVAKQKKDFEATIAEQQKESQSIAAQQQKEIQALSASLKEQASRIQKVSAQIEMNRPAPQTVVENLR